MPIKPVKQSGRPGPAPETGNEDIMNEIIGTLGNARSAFARKAARSFNIDPGNKSCKVL